MYTYLVNKVGMLEHFEVTVQQECKGNGKEYDCFYCNATMTKD